MLNRMLLSTAHALPTKDTNTIQRRTKEEEGTIMLPTARKYEYSTVELLYLDPGLYSRIE
jgi:hypothetical protein